MYRSDVLTLFSVLQKLPNVKRMKDLYLVHLRSLRFQSKRQVVNPGVEKRLEVLGFTEKDEISQEVLNELDHSESDFMNVHLSHHEYERDMEKSKHFIRSKIVEKKYFKENREPALLTWEEKEQVRHLHRLNPEKWNVHTLSNSFPASEYVIKKILKSKWTPASIDRIKEHNKSVERNWKMLYEGKLSISEETRAHLAKFACRKKIMLPPTDMYTAEITESSIVPVSQEFSDIIKPSKSVELISDPSQKVKQSIALNSFQEAPEDETYVIDDGKQNSKARTTLNFYREKILSSEKPMDIIDKAIIDGYKDTRTVMEHSESKDPVSYKDFSKPDKLTIELKMQQNNIRSHIEIPLYLRRKGSLYKLDDCYYDEDGELLYRVPGMG